MNRLLLGLLLTSVAAADPPADDAGWRASADIRARRALEAATEVGEYIIDLSRPTPIGTGWPDDGYRPAIITTGIDKGIAGGMLFFMRLHERTGERRYRDMVVNGADYLWASVPGTVDPSGASVPSSALYSGLAGTSTVLRAAHALIGDPRYADTADRCFEFINVLAHRDDGNVWWNDAHGRINGTAGIGSYLLSEFAITHDDRAFELAVGARDQLRRKRFQASAGWTWTVGEENRMVTPGRAQGTAGIGSVFLDHFNSTGNARDLRVAIEAGEYLERVGINDGVVLMTPVRTDPDVTRITYRIGWLDGVAGIGRYFLDLHSATGDDKWKRAFEKCVRAIHNAGYPDRPIPEFDDGTDMPFRPDRAMGSAAAASLLLARYRREGQVADLRLAWEMIEDILDASRYQDGLRWWDVHPVTGHFVELSNPIENPRAPTGYLEGAAGYGLLLLEFEATVSACDWAPLGIE